MRKVKQVDKINIEEPFQIPPEEIQNESWTSELNFFINVLV